MKWTRKKPDKEGSYLRSNPPISHISRIGVYIGIDGVLKVPDPNKILGIPVADLSDRFWWYGPIPPPPWKTQDTKEK